MFSIPQSVLTVFPLSCERSESSPFSVTLPISSLIEAFSIRSSLRACSPLLRWNGKQTTLPVALRKRR